MTSVTLVFTHAQNEQGLQSDDEQMFSKSAINKTPQQLKIKIHTYPQHAILISISMNTTKAIYHYIKNLGRITVKLMWINSLLYLL